MLQHWSSNTVQQNLVSLPLRPLLDSPHNSLLSQLSSRAWIKGSWNHETFLEFFQGYYLNWFRLFGVYLSKWISKPHLIFYLGQYFWGLGFLPILKIIIPFLEHFDWYNLPYPLVEYTWRFLLLRQLWIFYRLVQV